VEVLENRRVFEAERVDILEEDGTLRLASFGGRRVEDGHGAFAVLMFDQFKQDQVVGIAHRDSVGRHEAGLYVWDRPDEPFPAIGEVGRLFAGKTVERTALIELRDADGLARLRLSVAADGTAGLEFLDASGEVTTRLPA
jgi:hypothetical protein